MGTNTGIYESRHTHPVDVTSQLACCLFHRRNGEHGDYSLRSCGRRTRPYITGKQYSCTSLSCIRPGHLN
ncbi:hypothetical protein PAXRUDRAFT_390132 [Paxillus rubicundulus Ve08.2h10]|uniref:Uncharacterized protein n=1 Tax=Paxillus rubicundulus Ve08.2h10 TaxID=930991 RepID=A0A0D0C236_9AGAM|nr:hypothetical protein PAXRUDRAFT_390132 [Paxillus rubicundulus Ve08.2h10]